MCRWGMFLSPFDVFSGRWSRHRRWSMVLDDSWRWSGRADTRSVIQVRFGGGSMMPDLAAVFMLWGSSSASVGGWSSGVGHGGRWCFSFVSVALVDWIVISFSFRVLSVMWGCTVHVLI
jgi:hypothetical protein